jgi:hypothetical protein
VISFGSSAFDPIGGFLSIEKGSLTAAGTHQVSGSWSPGDNKVGGGAASCSGTVAGAAVNCFTVPFTDSCFVTVSISIGGISINTNGTTIWSSGAVPVNNTCAAKADPALSGGLICNPPTSSDFTADQDTTTTCDPILIDLKGNGFDLTNAAGGVVFDIRATGHPFRIPWTAGSNAAFLVLDRNGNGVIDDGTELFSNVSPQPLSSSPNGFKALAQYDLPENGGNGDGVIDSRDAIFSSLRLWIDANHDGISQSEELHTLPEMGVFSINLDFQNTNRRDQFGNVFLFSTKVNPGQQSDTGRKAYDVFFVTK